METIEPNILAIERKTVAIITHKNFQPFFQVTIDPSKLSPSKRFIRFGEAGDEMVGWQEIDMLTIHEVLAVEREDEAGIFERVAA